MPREDGSRTQTELYRFAGLGMQFAATLAVFGLLGYWLDGKLGTSPWLLLGGIFVGFAIGLFALVKAVPSARSRRRAARDRPDPPA
jgi:F0F1-type ATP synthase assembly protein I